MRSWRRSRTTPTHDMLGETDVVGRAVTSFRQRFLEDPEFKKDFTSAMRKAIEEGRTRSEDESVSHSGEYGDDEESTTTKGLHEIRGRAFTSIIEAISWMAEPGEPGPEEALLQIRSAVGKLANQAYFQAQIDPPLQLQQGALGVHYKDFGTVVVWEKVRGVEGALDQLAGSLPDQSSDSE